MRSPRTPNTRSAASTTAFPARGSAPIAQEPTLALPLCTVSRMYASSAASLVAPASGCSSRAMTAASAGCAAMRRDSLMPFLCCEWRPLSQTAPHAWSSPCKACMHARGPNISSVPQQRMAWQQDQRDQTGFPKRT
jgi:hypothetical protein